MQQALAQTRDPPRPRFPGEGFLRAARRTAQALDRVLAAGLHQIWLHGCIALSAVLVVWSALATPFPARGAQLIRPAAPVAPAVQSPASAAEEPAFRFQALSPDQAFLWNLLAPLSTAPNPPARPFVLGKEDGVAYERALNCLTAAIYYEAASESREGQQAVAQVVLNRLRHPAFPKSVCGVVFEGSELPTGCQFSFTCDGSLERTPSVEAWARAREAAVAALDGFVARGVGQATHYHAVYVAPYWSPTLAKVSNIGAHIFYRWMGGAGLPRAFTGAHAGEEPYIARLAMLDAELTPPPRVEAPILVAAVARVEVEPSPLADGLGLGTGPSGAPALSAELPAVAAIAQPASAGR